MLFLLSLLTTSAPAVIYAGNPDLSFHVQRLSSDLESGSGYLIKVRIHECGSLAYTDYPVGQSIDPVDGYSMSIAGGDLCGATLFWAADVTLAGHDGTSFALAYTDRTTSIPFETPIAPVVLTPIEIVSGSPGGWAPRLYASVE
jgi:hypothetical protein